MAEVIFYYETNPISIKCNKIQKMYDICNSLCNKINKNINSLYFLYEGSELNLDKKYNELTKENTIHIFVYKKENKVCSKCGRIINNNIDEIILLNNNINDNLLGLKSQIDSIIELLNKKDYVNAKNQLKNINFIINGMDGEFKKLNKQLNNIKLEYNINNSNIIKSNEINCIYEKNDDEIYLLHNYILNINEFDSEEEKNSYIESKNNINEKNLDIYVNNKKIKFDYKYKSKEKGEIKVRFKFKKLLNSISFMFWYCSSLIFIDLSSFCASNLKDMRNMLSNCSSLKSINLSSLNTSNVINMSFMLSECSSLKSIDFSSFKTSNVNNMAGMFFRCSSLKSINLFTFNTSNVKDMRIMFNGCSSLVNLNLTSFNTSHVSFLDKMFSGCSSLKSIDLSSFNTSNVICMDDMFSGCSSLISIDLSSFDTSKVKNNIKDIFKGCSSLKKNNVKIKSSEKKILDELKN